MKKSIFIILPLILWAFAACDNDDSEWDSGNLGVNSVEGTWQRVGGLSESACHFWQRLYINYTDIRCG